MPSGEQADDSSVKVAVRVRPLIPKERACRQAECALVQSESNTVLVGKDRSFAFDFAYGPQASQSEIYGQCIHSLVENCFAGYNATVFAYGQTGSGKTFTMGTAGAGVSSDEAVGIIPRVIEHLFSGIEKRRANAEFLVRVSFLEVYNEDLRDLLNPSTPSKDLAIREDSSGNINVTSIAEEVVTSAGDLIRCLEEGSAARTVGGTLMNAHSSRSHAIFTIVVEQRVSKDGVPEYIASKFHLIDLAGSERNKRTGNTGVRFEESVAINQGLLALGNVISALSDDKRRGRGGHVPYRESKLTRLLQDSLGGNSKTVMIACASPADANFEETLNTLRYASRARHIRNRAVVNRKVKATQMEQLRNEIQSLQMELLKYREVLGQGGGEAAMQDLLNQQSDTKILSDLVSNTVNMDRDDGVRAALARNEELEQRVKQLESQLETTEKAHRSRSEEAVQARAESEHLYAWCERTVARLSELLIPARHVVKAASSCPKEPNRDSAHGSLESVCVQLPRPAVDALSAVLDSFSAEPVKLPKRQVLPAKEERPTRRRRRRPSTAGTSEQSPREGEGAGLAAADIGGGEDRPVTAPPPLKPVGCTPQKMQRTHSRVLRGLEEQSQALAILEDEVVRFTQEHAQRKQSQELPSGLPGEEGGSDGGDADDHFLTLQRLEEEIQDTQKLLSQRDVEVIELQNKLNDAEADLKRDEAIFSEKMAELKALSKEVKTQRLAQSQLESALAKERERGHALEAELRNLQKNAPRWQSEGGADAAEPVEQDRISTADSLSRPPQFWADDNDPAQTFGDEDSVVLGVGVEPPPCLPDGTPRKTRTPSASFSPSEEDEQQRSFRASQQRYSQMVRDLTVNIKMKEDHIHMLLETEAEGKEARGLLEERLRHLETEVEKKEEQLRSFRATLGQSDASPSREKDELRHRLADMEEELEVLRIRYEEQEKALAFHQQREKRVGALETELDAMRAEREMLKKKWKDLTKAHEADLARKEKEFQAIKRKTEDAERKLRQLEADNLRQKEVINKQKARNRSGIGRPPPKAPQTTDKSEKEWLDSEIEKLTRQKEAAAMLERQLSEREGILKEKEQKLAEFHQLQLKKMRSSAAMQESIVHISKDIEKLDTCLDEKRELLNRTGAAKRMEDLSDEVNALTKQKSTLICQRAELQLKADNGSFLTEEEESVLVELAERIDDFEAEIDYRSDRIEQIQHEIDVMADEGGAINLDNLTIDEAKVMLRRYFEKAVELKAKTHELTTKLDEIEVSLVEKDEDVRALSSSVHTARLHHDRQLMKLRKEYERLMVELMRHVPASGSSAPREQKYSLDKEVQELLRFKEEQAAILDKHVLAYKKKTRSLHQKVQMLTQANESDRERFEKALSSKEAELENYAAANRNLETELVNLKAFLRQYKFEQVRVSVKDLKPVDPSRVTPASSVSVTPVGSGFRRPDPFASPGTTEPSTPTALMSSPGRAHNQYSAPTPESFAARLAAKEGMREGDAAVSERRDGDLSARKHSLELEPSRPRTTANASSSRKHVNPGTAEKPPRPISARTSNAE
eukprot:Rmarinus@m.8893